MPTITQYYMNSSSLLTCTGIYQDALMTYPAMDGFYSDGKYSREIAGGILFPAKVCEECSETPSSSAYRVVNSGDIVPVSYTNDQGAQTQNVPANGTIFVCSLTVPTGGSNLTITFENQVCT